MHGQVRDHAADSAKMRALRKTVIVEPIQGPAMHAGLHLVGRLHPPSTAKVIAIGPSLHKIWPDLKRGMTVAIKPMGGMDIEFEGRKLKLMDQDGVLGVFENAT